MIKYIFFFITICILLIIFFFLLFFLLFFIFVYLIVYYLLQINNNFVDYNEKTKKIINKYGDYKIVKMYVCKQKLSNIIDFIINIITFYKYSKHLQNNKMYHIGLIIILKNSQNKLKILKIDKMSTSIYIDENFKINSCKKIKNVSIHKNKYSLKELLDKTKKNMGEINFFNWELQINNCQHFVKNLIKSIQKKKNKIIIQSFIFTKSETYILNIITILYTLFYKDVLNFYFNINDNININ